MTERTQRINAWPADITALLARIVVGAVFIAHGLQKIGTGVDGVAQGFGSMGIPLPQVAAVTAMTVEIGGGLALIVGFALPAAGAALAAFMVGAYTFAHVGDALVGGYEVVLVLGASALALGFSGGSLAVDRFLPWGTRRAETVRAAV
ncbi:DoxX family protein [Actinorugispora endophytica]|uniref:Putative oxidoreductase n=1 Tax=Actinorugispora endophytica TaxID=1605990 RepID=A0A4R6UL23_9ACTN|nr:DoxX family protein [Actinorugispora endophytica]TDQ47581.1 putative oxidoreductase [Actinorugispora endophytica]